MKKIPIYAYYAFGYNYGLIKKNNIEGQSKESVIEKISGFLVSLEQLDAPVALKISENLSQIVSGLNDAEDKIVSAEITAKIIREIEKIDPALDAELMLKESFLLTEKRFPLKSLTGEVQKLLGENVYDSLALNAQKDFSLACMQVALNQPTAVAFHLMRAIEEEVKKLYFLSKKQIELKNQCGGQ